jgi:hypothetical protein
MQEVTQLLSTADAALALQEASFQQLLMQGTPSSSLSGSSSYDEPGSRAERQQRSRALLNAMQATLADAAANVQRLYEKWVARCEAVGCEEWCRLLTTAALPHPSCHASQALRADADPLACVSRPRLV